MNRLLSGVLGLLLLAGAAAAADDQPLPEFAYKDLNGKLHRLSDYRGKWVVVNYWATWCPPCLEEIPELEVFHNSRQKDGSAVVLGLDMEDLEPKQLSKFVEEQFISYPILPVGESPAEPLGRIPGLPTTYLVAPDGQVVARQVGGVTTDSLNTFIQNYQITGGDR